MRLQSLTLDDMFDDLPFIISQVVKEQAKMQEWKLDSIKEFKRNQMRKCNKC
jgi:hypothetical protein